MISAQKVYMIGDFYSWPKCVCRRTFFASQADAWTDGQFVAYHGMCVDRFGGRHVTAGLLRGYAYKSCRSMKLVQLSKLLVDDVTNTNHACALKRPYLGWRSTIWQQKTQPEFQVRSMCQTRNRREEMITRISFVSFSFLFFFFCG